MKKLSLLFACICQFQVFAYHFALDDSLKVPVVVEHAHKPHRFSGGIIPYQFLSRSVGLYLSYSLSKSLSLELRPTYTLATHALTDRFLDGDRFYFKGFNGNLLLDLRIDDKLSTAIMLGYSDWSYDHEWIFSGHKTDPYTYYKSSRMTAPFYGLEVAYKLSFTRLDFKIYLNYTYHFWQVTSTVYDREYTNPQKIFTYTDPPDYPEESSYTTQGINFALGFKVGLRSKN